MSGFEANKLPASLLRLPKHKRKKKKVIKKATKSVIRKPIKLEKIRITTILDQKCYVALLKRVSMNDTDITSYVRELIELDLNYQGTIT